MSMGSDLKPSRVKIVEIDADQADQRIDNFLLGRLKGVPRTRIYRLLRRGEVRVNKGRVKPAYRLRAGDQVRIPPIRQAERVPGRVGGDLCRRLEAAILFEDARFLVLNKPRGVAVHGGSGISAGVIEALRQARPDARYLELVHRLDRETSGCLLIAKKRSALRILHELMRENRVDKRYHLLVAGRWPVDCREVDAPLHKNQLASGERVVRISPVGKAARTGFRQIAGMERATFLEAVLHTGRTHQIRVHTAHVGHPVAGDEKYGDRDFNRWIRGQGLQGMFLHAFSLAFTWPESGERFRVQAPLDDNLREVLARLGLSDGGQENGEGDT